SFFCVSVWPFLDSLISACVSVRPSSVVLQCADRIGMGFSRVYQSHFMREMVAYVKDKQRLFAHQGMSDRLSTLEKLGPLDNMRTFWDFDGRITAPLHGYADAEDYYRRASSRYFLGRIETPTLIIQATDDPFVFPHSLPEATELSPSIEFELHAHGGHVGFVEGSLTKPGYYLERRIPQWLAERAHA
ncbi:MAG: alpha/beta fold hydrolase, partial [Gammaproteobacteria bacterium]|nr:alpha/beta fold hydrolase [Gammaproteobacteria bacterium]